MIGDLALIFFAFIVTYLAWRGLVSVTSHHHVPKASQHRAYNWAEDE